MKISAKKKILVLTALAAAVFTGCQRSGRAEEVRNEAKENWRYTVEGEHGLPKREYAMAAVTDEMIYGCYQKDNIFTIAFLSRESGKIEKQVPLPEKVSYVQDMRVDKVGNLYVTSAGKLGGSDTHWKIDKKGNLREA